MAIQESGEMYLETILILTIRDQSVRSIDVARYMNFSKPSVSRAMGRLKEQRYIEIDNEGYITLTDSGRGIAEKIYERHNVLSQMLVRLGVDEQTATQDACKIEHDISDETFAAIKRHVETYGSVSSADPLFWRKEQ